MVSSKIFGRPSDEYRCQLCSLLPAIFIASDAYRFQRCLSLPASFIASSESHRFQRCSSLPSDVHDFSDVHLFQRCQSFSDAYRFLRCQSLRQRYCKGQLCSHLGLSRLLGSLYGLAPSDGCAAGPPLASGLNVPGHNPGSTCLQRCRETATAPLQSAVVDLKPFGHRCEPDHRSHQVGTMAG